MRFSGWLGSVRTLFGNRLRSRVHRRRTEPRIKQSTFHQVETLEQRRVLTLDFVSAYVEEGSPFFITNVTSDAELAEPIQQMKLSFTPGVELDGSSDSLDGIKIYRAGSDDPIDIGALVVDDSPNENQVVIRFSNQVVDDEYTVKISSSTKIQPNAYTGIIESTVNGLRSFNGSGEILNLEDSVSTGVTATASEANNQDQVVVDTTTGIVEGMLVFRPTGFLGSVLSVDSATTIRLSTPVTLGEGTELSFETNQIKFSSSAGVVPGMLAVGDGVAGGTTVLANDLQTGTITLSKPIQADLEEDMPLRFVLPELFRNGSVGEFSFRVSLGQQVTSVVPQPIERGMDVNDLFGLKQQKNILDVYFDRHEALDIESAEVVSKYKLIQINEATGADDNTSPVLQPTSVSYVAEDENGVPVHKARLAFNPSPGEDGHDAASPFIEDGALYRLEIGGAGLIGNPANSGEVAGTHDSFAGAEFLGPINQSGLLVSGSIDPLVEIQAPGTLPSLFYPSQEGSIDEPGHRIIPIDDASHGLPEITSTAPGGQSGIIHNIEYNFRSDYGVDTQGNQLFNAITGEQRLRVREIFDLFSRYAGIRFIETDTDGITVATGDTAVISDNTPRTSVNGLARGFVNRDTGEVSPDAIAIVNSLNDWGTSEYGGGFFQEAMRQIGQVLGLWQSYDLPSLMGESLPGENVFPSDYDILHLQQLYPRAGTEIDVYSITLEDKGNFQAETFAERLAAGASTLDTAISVYDANGEIVSRNDDSFGRDSRIALELDAGAYFVAVSSTGTSYDLNVSNSGSGGFTQGAYDLLLSHVPETTADNTIVDKSGSLLDGDRDGKEGGAFNFHFRTAAEANTIFVDKITTDSLVPLYVTAENIRKAFDAEENASVEISLVSGQSLFALETTIKQFQEVTGSSEITVANGGGVAGIKRGMVVEGGGIPDETTVTDVNLTEGKITLSTAVTLSADEALTFKTIIIKEGMVVEGANIPNGTTVDGVDLSEEKITLSNPVVLSANQELDFKHVRAELDSDHLQAIQNGPIEPGMLVLPLRLTGDESLPEGTVVVSNDSTKTNLTTAGAAAVEERVTTAGAVPISTNIGSNANGLTILVDDATGITDGMHVAGVGVPEGTTVDGLPTGNSITLSQVVQVQEDSALQFWDAVSIDNATNIVTGMLVEGAGIPEGTTVLAADIPGNTITLSKPISALENTALKFWQVISVNDTTGIEIGMWVGGAGVSYGTKVIAFNAVTNEVTLSKPATLSLGANLEFWFDTTITFSEVFEIDAGQKIRFVTPGDGSLANPFRLVSDAQQAAVGTTELIRIVGNQKNELENNPAMPQRYDPEASPYDYYFGESSQGDAHEDGANFTVPEGVVLMLDGGATFRMENTNLDVGSSSQLVSRSGAALQSLGTPDQQVEFTSIFKDASPNPNALMAPRQDPRGGDWGGIVLRPDSDWQPQSPGQLQSQTLRPVLNNIANTVISFGGGEVVVDAEPQKFSALQIEDTRPIVSFSSISSSADAAISATPSSFEESNGRAGPEFRGNSLVGNSTNGVFLAIETRLGEPIDKLDVSARFASTEVTYVMQESLVLAGGEGSYFRDENDIIRARSSGRLQIDPGVVVKSKNSRIELGRGNAQLLAEGEGYNRIIFTGFNDTRFGAGGEFDTNGDSEDVIGPGDWGGIVLNAGSSASIDNAYITLGGGEVPIEGGLDDFNVIEVHQADLRLTNSRVEHNASGLAETDRTSRGANEAATIFVRGSQPIIVGNDFRNNSGALISINANSLIETELGDSGRQVGEINRFEQYDDNHGPLISDNRISNTIGGAGPLLDGETPPVQQSSQFSIDVTYESDVPANMITAFDAAIARWEEVIIGDLSDQVDGDGIPVDDLSINVQTGLLGGGDGPGGPAANAGPRLRRDGGDANPYLAYTGEVGIDMQDNPTGYNPLFATGLAIHEIGHILGFTGGVLGDFGYHDANLDYINGENALREYQKIVPGAQVIPMQDGTGAHWEKAEFGYEVMTPSIGNNYSLSLVSAGLLDDIGYEVDYSAFDEYTHSNGTTLTPPASISADRQLAGVMIRAEEIVVESVWDDTDIVHVVTDEIIVNNFHTATGLRLESNSDASLVVKLDGSDAGFTASGEGADIDDRIGGTVQVVGQPGFPVVLTSLADDTVGASLDVLGFPVTDTNVDGSSSEPARGNWRSLRFLPLANDRNVQIINEVELPYSQNRDENNVIGSSELLGILAPNFAIDGNTWESAQEKTGDENRRLGFEVHGSIAYDNPADVDIYTFDGTAGSEIWIDVDKTSSSLDTMVELLDASGRVLARSADSQNDFDAATDVTVTAAAGGVATVTGQEATVVGTAAATTGVGAVVDGVDVTVTGVAAQAVGYQSQVIGIGAQAAQASAIGEFDIQLNNATGIHVGAAATLAGVIPGGATVTAVDGNTITLDQALIGNITNEWIEFGISGVSQFSSNRIIFDTPPEVGVWVGLPASGNVVQTIEGTNIAVLAQAVEVVPESNTVNVVQNFGGGGLAFDENGQPNNAESGIQGQGNQFYRLLFDQDASNGRTISFGEIAPASWDSLTVEAEIRFIPVIGRTPGEGHAFVLQNTAASDLANGLEVEQIGGTTNGTNTAINQLGIHFDLNTDAGGTPVPHMSFAWGDNQQDIEIDNWADSNWHDVEIEIVSHPQGGMISISLDGEFILEDEVLVGYQPGQQTRFIAAARSGPGQIDGTHDIDNVFATSLVPLFTTSTVGNLGLSAVAKPVQNLLVGDGTPVLNGATVNGGLTEVDANTTPIDPDNSTIALVELDNTVTVNENQLLTFSLTGGQNVDSQYITVNDVADVQVGAKINGLAGIPDGTRVADVDLGTNTIELSVPISNVSLGDGASVGYIDGDNITVVDASTLADGMPVSSPNSNNVTNGAEIAGGGINLVSNEITLTQPFDVADGEFLQFGFLGATVETPIFFVDEPDAITEECFVFRNDPAIDVTNPGDAIARVDSIDNATGAVVLRDLVGNFTPILIQDNELLLFGFNGEPVTASRVVLDLTAVGDVSAIVAPVLVNMVGAGVLDQEVPDGTEVVTFDSATSNILELSQPVTVSNADDLGFGFFGISVVLDDITGIEIGEAVSGPGVPAGTTVVNTSNDDVNLDPNTIVLSDQVNVEDAVDLTFSIQGFSALAAAAVPGVAILPGTLTGVVYDGEQAIQTFTSNRNGTLDFTAVGNPGSRVTTGTVDYETGSLSLEFDNPPRDGIELRDVAFEYGNLSLGTLGFAQNNGVWENGAFPLTKDAYRGGDYYTTNPRDAGMRVTLPGTQGTEQKYFVRVRSQPEIGADLAAHETNLTDTSGNGLTAGQTSGSYELRIRTRQRDDKPGSVVTFADIRYPTIGIDVQGLPNNSPLVGTTGEDDSNNDTFLNAQETGNLLSSDRNTISTSGRISERNDVDWYEFDLTYEDIQTLTTHNNSAKTFATIFDIDYADGLRGDYGLAVFDSDGHLIYVGRDSNITDDQPGAGQANDFDDLSRGSVGALDPFIGSAHLEAGFNDQSRTYYVAVSSNGMLPTALDQAYVSAATNPLLRLEPVSSVSRIVEDHIGSTGYETYGPSGANAAGIIEVGNENLAGSSTRLSAHVRPWTLQDMTLYVSAGDSILTTNPFTADGYRVQRDYGDNNRIGDLDMRTDGTLMQYVGINGDQANNGILFSTDWATGDRTQFGADSIANVPNANFNAQTDWYKNTNDTVDAVAIRRSGVATYNATNANSGAAQAIYYSVRDGGVSVLYSADNSGNADGSEAAPRTHSRGLMGEIESAPGEAVAITGLTTGLQFQNDVGQLFGVSSGGQFYEVNRGTAQATNVVDFSAFLNNGEGFQGLTTGPVNLEGGRFAGRFFAVTNTGRLVCIDPTGADDGTAALVDNVFDTRDAFGNVDGIADSFVSDPTTGAGGVTGLAFSPLDMNLWHPTELRRGDDGHGVNVTADNSRPLDVDGRISMYFGLETWSVPNTSEDYLRYDNNEQFGAQGNVPYTWQRELTANADIDIGENYNLPGGAHGSLVTGTFSLADLSYTDKPTAYISYFLDTQDASSSANADSMRDAARILGSADGGLTWELLATNNQERSGFDGVNDAELPPLLTASSAISTAGYLHVGNNGLEFVGNQQVQELFDTAGWRQTRIDLGMFAGESAVQLRFDFSTYGDLNRNDVSNIEPDTVRQVVAINGPGTTVTLNSVEGLAVGMIAQTAADVLLAPGDVADGVVTITQIDPANSRIVLSGGITTLEAGQNLDFFSEQALKNNIRGNANQVGDWGQVFASAAENNHEGFYIDDIIVGTAERGEMITGAVGDQTAFYSLPAPPIDVVEYPEETLLGDYQLEVRRGTEYLVQPDQTTNSGIVRSPNTSITGTFHTNDRFVQAPSGPALFLGRPDLGVIDGAELRSFGNGAVTVDGVQAVLASDVTTQLTRHNALTWAVDLAGQDSAFLSFTATRGESETVTSLPDQFTFNAWDPATPADQVVGLPEGDGVALSTDGGITWTRLADFSWTGDQVVDLAAVDTLTGNTRIGFFQSGGITQANDGGVSISDIAITTAPLAVHSTGTIGDSNNTHELEQGQFIVASNIISNADSYGVRIDAGRDTAAGVSNAPHAGAVRNLPVLVNSRLIPGVVVQNNVIEASGSAGISYLGAVDNGAMPDSARPFGRLINNTIVGSAGTGTGINIRNNAATTLMNNVFADLATGVFVDGSSRADAFGNELTEIDTSAFYLVGTEVEGADQEYGLTLTSSPFMDITSGNYYPSALTPIVDSSLNSLADRQPTVVEKEAIGIAASPIITPSLDLFGQVRADDPDQATDVGLGFDPFKDRGAIERVDRSKPTASLHEPRDNGDFLNLTDVDNDANEVRLQGLQARGVERFVIQLEDRGVGINKSSIVTDALILTKDGVELVDGVDYFFQFNANTNQVILSSTVVYGLGDYTIEMTPSSDSGELRFVDLAGNQLFTNDINNGSEVMKFVAELADAPSAPTQFTAVAGDGEVLLDWDPPTTSASSPITGYVVEQLLPGATQWTPTMLTAGQKTGDPFSVSTANHQAVKFRVYATNSIDRGPSSDEIFATPSQPTIDSTNVGYRSVDLTWNGSKNDGGNRIESYVIEQIAVANSLAVANVDAKGFLSGDGLRAFVFADADEDGSSNELMIYDTSNLNNIQLLGSIPGFVNAKDVIVSSDGLTVYVVDEEGLSLYNIFNIALPITQSKFDVSGATRVVLNVSDEFALLDTGHVIDVRNKNVPLSEKSNLQETWNDAAVVGDKLYAVNSAGLQIFNIQDLEITETNTSFDKYATDFSLDGANRIIVTGDLAYIADGDSGITVVDVSELDTSDPDNPAIIPLKISGLGFVDSSGSPVAAKHVAVAGDRAYVGAADNLLRIVDVSEPTDLNVLEKRLTPSYSDVHVSDLGGVVLSVDGNEENKMYVVDTTDGFYPAGQLSVDPSANPDTETYSTTIADLTKNVGVYFRVAAVNTVGTGSWSEYSDIQYPEGAPNPPTWAGPADSGLLLTDDVGVTIDPDDGSIVLTWKDPAYTGGPAIDRYILEYRQQQSDPDGTPYAWVRKGNQLGSHITDTNYTFDNLEKGLPYSFRVAAININNDSDTTDDYDWSDEVTVTTPDVPTQKPIVTGLAIGNGTVNVSWTAIVSNPLAVTGYVVAYSNDSGVTWNYEDVTGSDTIKTLTLPRLAVGTYQIKVAGKNSLAKNNGIGITNTDYNYSKPSDPLNTESVPSQVEGLSGTAQDAAVTLTWTAVPSEDNGGKPILGYVIEYKEDSATEWTEKQHNSTTGTYVVTGLTNGIAHTFRVEARNVHGSGSVSNEAGPYTPVGVPLEPLSLSAPAGPGDGEVTLNWTINGDGGSPLTGHRVEWKLSTEDWSQSTSVAEGAAVDAYTITGLVKDTEYDVRVIAVNINGDSVPAVGSVIPFGPPDAPTGLQFTPDQTDGSLQLSWTAPTNDGGERQVTYEVEYRLDGGIYSSFVDQDASDLSADIANLTPGSSHDFRVRAVNDSGESAWHEASFDAPDAPDALTGVTASTTGNNDGVVTLSWDTPTPTGLPVTDYKIQQSLDGFNWADVTATPEDNSGTGKTTVEISGLDRDNGDHFFRVAGLNVLTQNESDTVDPQLNYQSSDPMKPLDLPGTVRTLQATEGDGQVNLTWLQPLDNDGSQNAPGGEPITDYEVYYRQSTGNWNLLSDAVTPSLSAVVPSLTNGTLYDFKVVAKTRLGEGPSDETDTSVNVLVVSATPRGAPAKPTNVSITALTGSLRVTWQAGSNNGAPISDHIIEVAESTNGPWISYADSDGVDDDTSATISGVPTGVNLYVQVAAINEANDTESDAKLYSDVVGPVVALGAPAAPTGLTAAANTNGTISLNWNAPTNIGGSAITDYVVEYRKITEQDWNVYEDGSNAFSNTVITTLVRDDGPFEFRIKASNSIGTGPASDVSVNVMPLAAPKAVQIQSITEGNEQLSVTWTAPSDNGGATVTDYIIEYKTTTQSIWTEVNDGTSTSTSVTIAELTNGGNYQVRIRAVNSVGAGDEAISATARPVTRPGIPGALNVEADSNQAKLTWTAPDHGGRTITDYVIEYRLASSSTWTTWNDGVSADTEETINVLTNGESYLFRVKAVTSFGESDYATSEAAIIGPKAPAPIFAILQPHEGGLHVTYGRVVAPAGYEVLGHRIDYYDTETSQWITAKEVSALHNSATIEELDSDQTYTVRVAAITSIGVGNFKLSNQVTL